MSVSINKLILGNDLRLGFFMRFSIFRTEAGKDPVHGQQTKAFCGSGEQPRLAMDETESSMQPEQKSWDDRGYLDIEASVRVHVIANNWFRKVLVAAIV